MTEKAAPKTAVVVGKINVLHHLKQGVLRDWQVLVRVALQLQPDSQKLDSMLRSSRKTTSPAVDAL